MLVPVDSSMLLLRKRDGREDGVTELGVLSDKVNGRLHMGMGAFDLAIRGVLSRKNEWVGT